MIASSSIDLGGYPVLRVDQIPSIESDVLRRADKDVRQLLESYSTGEDTPPPKIVFYLQKQLDIMKNELACRAASERIQLLLSDALLDTSNASSGSSVRVMRGHEEEGAANSPSASSIKTSLSAGASLLPRSREVSSAPSSSLADPGNTTHMRKDVVINDKSESQAPSRFTPLPLPSEVYRSNANANTRAGPATDNAAAGSGSGGEEMGEGEPSSSSGLTSAAPAARPRRRPSSSDNNYTPSSRSLGVLNEKFGSAFMVAPTEKKRRFFAKKKTEENPEDVRARERLERRKVAMKRLMERREQQQKQQQQRREQRSRFQQTARKGTGSSSGEESISGGDDDDLKDKIGSVDRIDEGVIESVQLGINSAIAAEKMTGLKIALPCIVSKADAAAAKGIHPQSATSSRSVHRAAEAPARPLLAKRAPEQGASRKSTALGVPGGRARTAAAVSGRTAAGKAATAAASDRAAETCASVKSALIVTGDAAAADAADSDAVVGSNWVKDAEAPDGVPGSEPMEAERAVDSAAKADRPSAEHSEAAGIAIETDSTVLGPVVLEPVPVAAAGVTYVVDGGADTAAPSPCPVQAPLAADVAEKNLAALAAVRRLKMQRAGSQSQLLKASGSQSQLLEASGSQSQLLEASGSQSQLLKASGSQSQLLEASGSQSQLLEASGSQSQLLKASGSGNALVESPPIESLAGGHAGRPGSSSCVDHLRSETQHCELSQTASVHTSSEASALKGILKEASAARALPEQTIISSQLFTPSTRDPIYSLFKRKTRPQRTGGSDSSDEEVLSRSSIKDSAALSSSHKRALGSSGGERSRGGSPSTGSTEPSPPLALPTAHLAVDPFYAASAGDSNRAITVARRPHIARAGAAAAESGPRKGGQVDAGPPARAGKRNGRAGGKTMSAAASRGDSATRLLKDSDDATLGLGLGLALQGEDPFFVNTDKAPNPIPNPSPRGEGRSRSPQHVTSLPSQQQQPIAFPVDMALLRKEDDVYTCPYGPDELPGLKAWVLSSARDAAAAAAASGLRLVWTQDIRAYHEPSFDSPILMKVRLQRALDVRTVSYGLVMLAERCQDIIAGRALPPPLTDLDLFRLWEKRFRAFDRFAAAAEQKEAEELLRPVHVCGNAHAVCRKLENILKMGNIDLASGSASSSSPVPSSNVIAALHVEEVASAASSPRAVVSTLMHTSRIQQQQPSELEVVRASNDSWASVAQNNIGSDDEPYLPAYEPYLPAPVSRALLRTPPTTARAREEGGGAGQLSIERTLSLPSLSVVVPINAPPSPLADYHLQAISSSPASAVSAPSATASSAGARLAAIYSHIGLLFPVAYSAEKASGGNGISARALVECMQIQGKLYEEWLEVMSDYATVFSEDRSTEGPSGTRQGSGSATVYQGGTKAMHYRVKSSRQEVYNIVTDVLNNKLSGWEELPSGLGLGVSWNLLWTWSKPRLNMSHLLVCQRVNHFYDSKQLTRKDLLKKNLQRYTDMTGKVADAFEVMPQTFLLPHEYTQFVRAFSDIERTKEQAGLQNFWIMKPVGLSRGRGIVMIKDVASLTYSQTSVVQRYVERPLCLSGYKFDLRLFVVVTSFRPLEAFVYKDGFARVSTHQFSLDPSRIDDKFIHLTNSSIQKQNTEGPTSDNPIMTSDADGGGSKVGLQGPSGLWSRLRNLGIDTEVLWRNISLAVLKSLVVVDDRMTHQPCCFELFGYDVLIDEDLRPWLLEVNASPSLARETALDARIKNALVRDTVRLVDPPIFDRAAVARVLKRRLAEMKAGSKQQLVLLSKVDPLLEKDLCDIFVGRVPRQYGEAPESMGDFQQLAPNTKLHEHVLKLRRRIIKERPAQPMK